MFSQKECQVDIDSNEYHLDSLLLNLMADFKKLCHEFDILYPRKQSVRLRYFFYSMNELIDEFEREEMENNDKRYEQFVYDGFITEMIKRINGYLEENSPFLTFSQQFLNKYHIKIPKIHFISPFKLEKKELEALHQYEKKNYHQAVQNFNQTINSPKTFGDVKEKSINLVNKIESKRNTYETNNFWKSSFDYKRHTINLNKTRELLQSPLDLSIHNQYLTLIEKNYDDKSISLGMTTLIGSVLVLLALLISFASPATALLVGGSLAFTTMRYGAKFFRSLTQNTYAQMNEVQEAVLAKTGLTP